MAPKKKQPRPLELLKIDAAPVFSPSEQEWSDPLKYIAEVVRPAVEHTAGICRIVPPRPWVEGLAEAFAIDRSSLKFNARVQRVDQLQRKHTAVASQRFWNEYHGWMAANGIKRKGGKLNPVFNGQEIELDRFHAIVARRGGYEAVTEDRSWREIANVLDLEDKAGNAAFTLRKLYEKLLMPFDEHCQKRAEGGYGLLDAAMTAQASESKLDPLREAGVNEDEAAEILSAMLGLTPPDSKKKRKSGSKAGKGGKGGEFGSSAAGGNGDATGDPPPPLACGKCRGTHVPDKMLQCERCEKGWHLFCLAPPLTAPPKGDWVCPDCRTKEFEAFAFQDADDYTLEEFQQIATTFEEQWFGADVVSKLSHQEKEAEFWRIVEDGEDVVEVLYGADLDSGQVGSGFPRAPPLGNSNSPFATDPWNLSVLPRQGGTHSSLLRVLDGNIAGVTVPWVYVGMCFSSFCWHVEDHMFYSINYNHWGAPKQWYGVPAWAASKFEAVFKRELADQIEAQPDLLFQLLSMLSPRVLQKAGVPVYSATQAAGEFVVTFPNAYHGGFSLGVNLGEAVNFAPPDWLRFGAAALSRLRYFRKPCVVSQEEMLLRVALQQAGASAEGALQAASGGAAAGQLEAAGVASPGSASPLVCYYLNRELRRVVEEEWVLRAKLWSEGLRRSRRTQLAVGFEEGDKDDSECAICHLYMHLSAVECDCCPGRRVCLHHAHHLCGCHMNQRRLVYRHTLSQLEAVQAAVEARVPAAVAAELEGVEAAAESRTAAAAGVTPTSGAAVAAAVEVATSPVGVKQEPEEQHQQQQRASEVGVKAEVENKQTSASESAQAGGHAAAMELDGLPAGAAAAAIKQSSQQEQANGVSHEAQQQAGQQPPGAADEKATSGEQAVGEGCAQETPALQPQAHARANVSQQDGPVRPFESLDICPWDRAELPDWREALHRACHQWQQDAMEALAQGGTKAEQLEELAEECEQYLWGDVSDEVAELAGRIQVAAAYMARINAALKGKQGLKEVEALIAKDPKPVPDPPGLQKLVEGMAVAREWLQRADVFLDEGATVELKALEAFVNEANRLPMALPEANLLRERSAAARKLADTIRAALPGRDSGRRRTEQMDLQELRSLRGQAAGLRVDMPELNNMALALERVDVWQSRVRALTEMQAPLDELRELIEEAEGLPAAMPEVDVIRSLIERGEAWKLQMQAVVRNRTSLKKMREVLSAGLRLAVDLPEIEALRTEIRRREWEESARRSLGARQNTLTGLSELVATAYELGADDTPLVQGLRAKVEVAEAWEARAAELLDRQSEDLPESERPAVDEVHQLVAEGFAIGIKMERLTQLNNQLMASVTWMEDARAVLAKAAGSGGSGGGVGAGELQPAVVEALGGEEDGYGPMDEDGGDDNLPFTDSQAASGAPSAAASQHATPEPESAAAFLLAAAVAEAQGGGGGEAGGSGSQHQHASQQPQQPHRQGSMQLAALPPLPFIPKGQRRSKKSKQYHKGKGGQRAGQQPELSVIEQLLADYRGLLVRADSEAEGLRALRSMADSWLEEARPVLEQEFVTDDQLELLEGLIASGERVGLAMEQVDILKANVEALLWARKVRALLARLPAEPQQPQEQRQQSSLQVQHEGGKPQQEPQLQQGQQQRQQQGEPAAATLSEQQGETPGTAEVQQTDGEEEGLQQEVAAPTASLVPFKQRPRLSEATALLEEGYMLPCDERLYGRLQSFVRAGQEFQSRALHVLALARDGLSYAHTIDAEELAAMLAAADRLCLQLDSLPILQRMLADYREWEKGLRRLMQGESGSAAKPTFAQLQAASQEARRWPITSSLRALTDETSHKTGDWMERCRKLLAKRNTGARLSVCLDAIEESITSAVEQFERRLDAEKRQVASGGRPENLQPPTLAEDEKQLYCLCQRPFQSDSSQQTMISCDGCREWFHARCVGVNQSQLRGIRRYTCPICIAVKGNTEPLEQAAAKLQRTRRPERGELAAMLPELQALPVVPAEGEQLERLVAKFDRWVLATSRAIEVHEMSRNLDTTHLVLPLSEVILRQLLKSAMSLEIEATEHADRVLRLLRSNKWRARAEAAMGPPAKQGMEGMQKLLAEAQDLEINVAKDVTGSKVLTAIKGAKEWAEKAQACVVELKAAGKQAEGGAFEEVAAKAQELMKQGQQLGVKMDILIHQLKEHSKLHCLCKKPYNEDRLMLTCDYCQEPYHHGCVGLKAPGSQDGDGDDPPTNFRCPLCCMRMGVKYAHFHKLPGASLEALKEAALKLPPPPPAASPASAPASAPIPAAIRMVQAAAAAQTAQRAAAAAAPTTTAAATTALPAAALPAARMLQPVAVSAAAAAAGAPGAPRPMHGMQPMFTAAGWSAMPAAMASMAAGMRPGMVPGVQVPAAMVNPEAVAATLRMWQAGMFTAMPGMAPGMVFKLPPQLLAALPKQQAEMMAAQAAAMQARAAAASRAQASASGPSPTQQQQQLPQAQAQVQQQQQQDDPAKQSGQQQQQQQQKQKEGMQQPANPSAAQQSSQQPSKPSGPQQQRSPAERKSGQQQGASDKQQQKQKPRPAGRQGADDKEAATKVAKNRKLSEGQAQGSGGASAGQKKEDKQQQQQQQGTASPPGAKPGKGKQRKTGEGEQKSGGETAATEGTVTKEGAQKRQHTAQQPPKPTAGSGGGGGGGAEGGKEPKRPTQEVDVAAAGAKPAKRRRSSQSEPPVLGQQAPPPAPKQRKEGSAPPGSGSGAGAGSKPAVKRSKTDGTGSDKQQQAQAPPPPQQQPQQGATGEREGSQPPRGSRRSGRQTQPLVFYAPTGR